MIRALEFARRAPLEVRPEAFRFRLRPGSPLATPQVEVLERVKGEAHEIRRVFRVSDGKRQYAMKVQALHEPKRCVQATLGKSYLHTESRMLPVARARGLGAPQFIGYATRRRLGLVVQQALLCEWLPGRVQLMAWCTERIRSGDHEAVQQGMQLQVDFFARVRQSGMAEKDFAAHNILVRIADGRAADPAWIDLERAAERRPDDPQATARMAGAMLACWWVTTLGDQGWYERLAELICTTVPTPRGGWRPLQQRIDAVIDARIRTYRDAGMTERAPEPVALA